MPIYSYKATNEKNRAVLGKAVGFNQANAENKLRKRNLQPIWLLDVTDRLDTKITFFLNRVSSKDIVIFSREFSLMISSNVSILESLVTISDQTDNLKFKNIISLVAYEVDSGVLLSEALKKHGREAFSDFFINVVKAGETSGKLDEVLLYLADEMEKDYDLLKKFRGAMIYPIIVICGLAVVGFIMMYFVMPQLTSIIEETGAELPFATKMVIAVVDFLQNYLLAIVIFLIVCFVAFRLVLRTEVGREKFDIFKLRFPVIGRLFRLIYLIRFCRSLSTLMYGGVTLTRSLEVSADVVRNKVYQKLIYQTLEAVNEGHSSAYVFFDNGIYIPKMVPQMMSIGEKTGKLDEILSKISDFYGRELNVKLANLNTILEPAIMAVMGVGVAIMMAAVIMPMYSIANSI
jgi:type IV pilus assembly protein PilC